MTFEDIERMVADGKTGTIALAGSDDPAALTALRSVFDRGLAACICIGPAAETARAAAEAGFDLAGAQFVPAAAPAEAAGLAFQLAVTGAADAVMKGRIATPDLLRAAVQPGLGFRQETLLSHIAAFELPTYPKLLFLTDTGVVIEPDLAQKADILANALTFVRRLGLASPAVALLSATETPTPKLRCSTDAAALAALAADGRFGPCSVCGPLDLASAVNKAAAQAKGITWPFAGRADVLLVPSMSGGNILGKALIHLAGARAGGVVTGGKAPVILLSRASSAEDRRNSILLGLAARTGLGAPANIG